MWPHMTLRSSFGSLCPWSFEGRKSYPSIISEKDLSPRRKRIASVSNFWTSHWQKKKKIIFYSLLSICCEDNMLVPPSPQIRKLFHNYSGSRIRIRYFSVQCKWYIFLNICQVFLAKNSWTILVINVPVIFRGKPGHHHV